MVKMYMSKVWLYQQIVVKHRSIDEIAREQGVERSTIHRWALKFDLIREDRQRKN